MVGGGLQRACASTFRRLMPTSQGSQGSQEAEGSVVRGRGLGRGKGGPKGRGRGRPRRRVEEEEQHYEPHMIKLIRIGSYIVFLDSKFYRHEHMTKIEFYKNSQNFLSKETIYHN